MPCRNYGINPVLNLAVELVRHLLQESSDAWHCRNTSQLSHLATRRALATKQSYPWHAELLRRKRLGVRRHADFVRVFSQIKSSQVKSSTSIDSHPSLLTT